MNRHFCVIGYLPPADKFPTDEFKANLKEFPTEHKLILFSDGDHPDLDVIKIGNPEPQGPAGRHHKWFTNNRVFFTAARIALKNGYTHFLYLEADCRVGRAGWDDVVWKEFLEHPYPIVFGGTMVAYNPCNSDQKTAIRYGEAATQFFQRMGLPMGTYGYKGAADNTGSSFYVNGALGIYDVSELGRLFDLNNTTKEALEFAYDSLGGTRMWEKYGADALFLIGNLPSMFSSYGDVMSTPEQRMEWLKSGRFVAVHQVKGLKKALPVATPVRVERIDRHHQHKKEKPKFI